jgi:hypothetical protein
MNETMLNYYLYLLDYENMPKFLIKYLKLPSLVRLKKVGYFCGMDFASKQVYNFAEYISRYDHSLTVALITYKMTKNKIATLAGLFHDIATPCFSHVIDYMNEDYQKQESTEEYTEYILKKDKYLLKCLDEDNIDINDIIDFKRYTIVDNDRPKVCADRIDGVVLTGIGWTKNITKEEIKNIVSDMTVYTNEYDELEIGFKDEKVAKKVIEVSKSIDKYCHSNEDNYMMQLLAEITKYSIEQDYINYDQLYYLDEEKLFEILLNVQDERLINLIYKFKNIKLNDIPKIDLPEVKIRDLKPLVKKIRVNKIYINN